MDGKKSILNKGLIMDEKFMICVGGPLWMKINWILLRAIMDQKIGFLLEKPKHMEKMKKFTFLSGGYNE